MDDDFEKHYADELEMMNELENENPFGNQVQQQNKKNDFSKKSILIGESLVNENDNEDEIIPFTEIEININKKKARIETDKSFEDLNEEESPKISNSNITITKISNPSENSYLNRRKTLNFDHLKKSKDLSITFINGTKSTITMFECENTFQDHILTSKTSSLLEKPIDQLKYEISSDIIKKCKQNIVERTCNEMDTMEMNNNLLLKNKDENNHNLWVEKYSPKNFIDLLSDDGINRLVLTWLKSWDYVVFGKELSTNDKKSKAEANKMASKKRKRIFNQNEIELEEKLSELDEYKRPNIKVALLAGAPGLGKTTLAHIVANISGYNVIEMNASDDRSAEAFKQNIESVTQIKGNVSDKNFKPNLLVIDEIDGAPQSSVQVLINEINENSKKTKSKEGPSLLRPIICICNDLYAPSLKQLRQLAIVFQCPPIATHRLAERLYSICEQNNLSADIDALIALSDKSSNDVRSCLNTLQFLSKTTNRINAQLINQLNIGQKDYEKGIFTILSEIFFLANYKKNAKNDSSPSILNKFSYMASLCNNCDMDRLIQALHENYLSIRTRDGNFDSINTASEWFIFCDTLNKYIKEKQEYIFYGYERYIPVIFNLLFSTTAQQTKKFQYPHSYFDCITKLAKNENILKHFLSDMSPIARTSYNAMSRIVLDLFPYLIDILQPNLRAVSTQLFSKSEKERLDSLIRTMILFNINYRQERCADGQYSYVFEPSFDEVVKFNGLKQKKQLCYMIKQQIAREINTERLKMADKYKSVCPLNKTNVNNNNNNNNNSNKAGNNFFSSPVGLKTASILNKLKNNNVKKDILETNAEKQKEVPKDSGDMFARYFKKTPKVSTTTVAENIQSTTTKSPTSTVLTYADYSSCFSNDVWLKYKEGFVNAVRYNIKINKLL